MLLVPCLEFIAHTNLFWKRYYAELTLYSLKSRCVNVGKGTRRYRCNETSLKQKPNNVLCWKPERRDQLGT